jgi:signal transduction histidine kinase
MPMRNSLIYKLLGAFLLVIAIGAGIMWYFVSQGTKTAFNIYTTRSGQILAQEYAPVLADYYTQNQGWQGVDTFLQSDSTLSSATPMMGMGWGKGQGRQGSGGGMGQMMDQRLILIDARGVILRDTQNELTGKTLPASELSKGASITVNNQVVGTLIITAANMIESGSPSAEFYSSINTAILRSVAIAGMIALLLGAILFYQITAPLRKLTDAASAVSHGDLSQHVDITTRDEIGELGRAFNGMAENLKSEKDQRQRLVADIAHELRTPLTAMQGTLEGIEDGIMPMDNEQVSALQQETMLLIRLVEDLRLLSLAEGGQLRLEIRVSSLTGIIHQAIDGFSNQANQHDIKLTEQIPGDLPDFNFDPDRIKQVLNNLIGNAIRYTPLGCEIHISADYPAGIPGMIRVSVTDSGTGIPPEALPHVFDRFYRADPSRARSSGGSGLGLAIVKQLIEAHGGIVRAESPIFHAENGAGYGTRMSFTLPLKLF